MEKLRNVLVTNRTQADVDRAYYLAAKFDARNSRWHGTAEEWEEFNSDRVHGRYSQYDLNRVLRACSWLAGRLERYGYSVPGKFFPAVLIQIRVEPPYSGVANSFLAYRGETAVAMAFDRDGYEFIRWEENGETVSEAAGYVFTAEADRELVAVFDAPTAEASGVVGFAVVGAATVGKGLN